MEITGKENNGWSCIELEGTLDLHSIHELKDIFRYLIEQDKDIVLDFTKVKNVDSSGVSCMAFCQKMANQREKVVRIANPNPKVRIIFQITRGFEFFDIYDDVNAACEAKDVGIYSKAA